MRTLFLFLSIYFSVSLFSQNTHSVTANFTGFKSNDGKLFIALYNTKDSFLKEPYKTVIVDITDLKATVTFSDLTENEYAVSAFHDKNNNGKMDTNFIGIPKEAIGISNNAKGFMGPPKYRKAKFKVQKDIFIDIEIKKVL